MYQSNSGKGQGNAWTHGMVAILLFLIMSIAFPVRAEVSSNNSSSSPAILFTLTIEELVEIQTSTSSEIAGTETFVERQSGGSTNIPSPLDDLYDESKFETVLLLIDGFTVGTVNSPIDLKLYIRYLSSTTNRIEIFQGESAAWFGDLGIETVVNIVTKTEEVPES